MKKFQKVQEAYDILRDPQKRAMYDQVGHQRFQDSGAGDPGGPSGFPGGFQGGFSFGGFGGRQMDDVLKDMAEEFFGQRSRGGRSSMFSSYQVCSPLLFSHNAQTTANLRSVKDKSARSFMPWSSSTATIPFREMCFALRQQEQALCRVLPSEMLARSCRQQLVSRSRSWRP